MAQSRDVMIEKLADAINDVNYCYVGVKASPFAFKCIVFGLNSDEILALSTRFPGSGAEIGHGVVITGRPYAVINALAKLGYRVICSTGEFEVLWTLQSEL